MKKISVGTVISNGEVFLACHSTGNWFYDLPKGEQTEGEEPIHVALRELQEETGLVIEEDQLEDLGVFEYNKAKDLHLFLYRTDTLPGTENLQCTSFFVHPKSGKSLPEVDGYRYVSFAETEKYMAKSMHEVLTRLYTKHDSNM